ncbi:MAG: rod shape-determining protein MreC [Bacteroidia bacterium]|nr:rod shape-determining protein MreC [Bacteroidia bacterium]
MLRLISFLSAYRNAILFLILEGMAFYMIVNFNDYQRHQMGDFLLESTSTFYERRGVINRYFHLGRDNEHLMDENIYLREELLKAKNQIAQMEAIMGQDSLLRQMAVDTTRDSNSFSFIASRVIKNSTNKTYNYLVLDKGARDGVAIDMGVVSPEGIVGRVIRVSDRFSLALSALNVDFKLILNTLSPDSKKEDMNVGFYEWRGGDPRHAFLTYIPETAKLDTGYVVVTSINSQIFPPGYVVGKISRLGKQTQDGFYNAQMELSANFNSLTNVYLISSGNKPILDSLEKNLR